MLLAVLLLSALVYLGVAVFILRWGMRQALTERGATLAVVFALLWPVGVVWFCVDELIARAKR